LRCFDSPSPDAADAEPLGRTFIRSLEIDLSQRSRSAEAGVQSLPATRRVARTIYPLGPTPSGLGGGAAGRLLRPAPTLITGIASNCRAETPPIRTIVEARYYL